MNIGIVENIGFRDEPILQCDKVNFHNNKHKHINVMHSHFNQNNNDADQIQQFRSEIEGIIREDKISRTPKNLRGLSSKRES